MTSRLDPRFLGLTIALAAATFGCAAPDRRAADTPQVFEVALTAATPAGLPQCTKALQGTTAATESPAGIWTCQGTWVAIPCTNGLGGAVAYASATKSLWACTAGQWVNVVLPGGPQGQPGEKGAMGAPGKDGKAGATSIVAQTVEPPGANCAGGGTKIASGVDGDGDGSLTEGEIKKVTYVCNGAAGPAGASGRPGMLVTVSPEPAGANCPAGGQRIGVGVDTNGNGRLDDNESTFSFVCNGGAAPPSDDGSATPPPTVPCVNATPNNLNPAPNPVVEVAPGSPVLVSGTIADADGATSLMVNGVTMPLGRDGSFVVPVTSRYGLNHVAFEASDAARIVVRTGICSFLVADQFVDEGAPLAGGVALRLGQAAIDDGDRTGPSTAWRTRSPRRSTAKASPPRSTPPSPPRTRSSRSAATRRPGPPASRRARFVTSACRSPAPTASALRRSPAASRCTPVSRRPWCGFASPATLPSSFRSTPRVT